MQKSRVLFISQHFWPESFRSTDIAKFFIEKNCEVNVLCGMPNYPRGKFFNGYSILKNRRQKHEGINIARALEIPRGDNSNLRIFLNYVSFPFFSLLHVPRLLFGKYDKIFMFQTSPVFMTFAGIIVGKIKRIETTMYVLDLWPENLYSVLNIKSPMLRRLVEKMSHWHYRHVDKIIALSEQMRSKLQEVSGLPSEKIIVLPQAAEKLYEQKIRNKKLEKRFKDGFNLVFTGSITPAQSFDTIIDAATQLTLQGIKDINWIVVGDGMSLNQVQEKVKRAGLSSAFFFEGQKPVEDIPKYTTIAHGLIGCLVKSNLLEATIPAKVMSYIASGKPLILAMDGEVQDLINKKIRCGFAGPTENANILAENIKRVYDLPTSERKKMGKRGLQYHLKYFERNIILDKLYRFMLG